MQRPAWRVLKTRVKCEKVVRDQLLALGLEAYVPVIRRTARYVRKIKVYELPLITCYTFVRLPKDRRVDALSLPYVQGILRVDGEDCVVTDREMEWLERVSGSGLDVHVGNWPAWRVVSCTGMGSRRLPSSWRASACSL